MATAIFLRTEYDDFHLCNFEGNLTEQEAFNKAITKLKLPTLSVDYWKVSRTGE